MTPRVRPSAPSLPAIAVVVVEPARPQFGTLNARCAQFSRFCCVRPAAKPGTSEINLGHCARACVLQVRAPQPSVRARRPAPRPRPSSSAPNASSRRARLDRSDDGGPLPRLAPEVDTREDRGDDRGEQHGGEVRAQEVTPCERGGERRYPERAGSGWGLYSGGRLDSSRRRAAKWTRSRPHMRDRSQPPGTRIRIVKPKRRLSHSGKVRTPDDAGAARRTPGPRQCQAR